MKQNVGKAVKMAKMMDIPLIGVVENYSYLECPDCGKRITVFGESHVDEIAASFHLDVLGRMPIDPAIAKACDQGNIEDFSGDWLDDAVEAVLKAKK